VLGRGELVEPRTQQPIDGIAQPRHRRLDPRPNHDLTIEQTYDSLGLCDPDQISRASSR
jgi:hypothetical protein